MTTLENGRCHAATRQQRDGSNVAELLTTVLGPDTAASCRKLCLAGGLHWLAVQTRQELAQFGLEVAAIDKLTAVVALCRRFHVEAWADGEVLQSSSAVYAHFHKRLAGAEQEQLYVVFLDSRNQKLGEDLVALGSANVIHVEPRDIFRSAIRVGAVGVLLVHNHPGDPTPSDDDLAMTRQIREAGELIGIHVVDHLIVGKTGYVSFVDQDYW